MRAELYGAISSALCEMDVHALVGAYFRGLEPQVLQETPLRLSCDCDRARIERVLISLGAQQLREMIEQDGGAEVCCQFCRRRYAFTEQELTALLERAGRGDA